MDYRTLHKHTIELLEYIENEKYLGYDPYDFYLSPYAKYFPKSILFLHLQKISPINLRPLLGIHKDMVTKVYGLMIDSYLNLYTLSNNIDYLNKSKVLYNQLLNVAVVDTEEELGWGRNYPFKTGGEIHDNKKPLVYLDSRLGLSIVSLYDKTQDKELLSVLKRVITNIIRTGRVLKDKQGYSFIGYSPDKNTRLTFNASMVATELFIKYLDRSKQHTCLIDNYDLRKVSYDIINTMIHYQEKDGSWAYGYSAKGELFSQRDFHQGFVIDSLYNILPYIEEADFKKQIQDCYSKGYDYLKNIQIGEDGEFYWRYPKKYPIDIHNQAQGILSLSINQQDNNNKVLDKIISYTFHHFWNKSKHCFYYQKWWIFRNKISYIRWCNAWMLFSLSSALISNKIK